MSLAQKINNACQGPYVAHSLCTNGCTQKIQAKGSKVSFSLKDAPNPHIVLDCEEYYRHKSLGGKRCDFLFIANGKTSGRAHVVVIEVKNKGRSTSQIREQLQRVTNLFVQKIVNNAKMINLAKVDFVPVFVGNPGKSRESLAKERVNFRGKKRIYLLNDKDALVKAILQATKARKK